MFTVKVKKSFIQTFKKKPFFFIHVKNDYYMRSWCSINDNIIFTAKFNFSDYENYVLMLANVSNIIETQYDEWYKLSCHKININSIYDWTCILKSAIGNNKYSFKYLFWCLNDFSWNNDIIISAIRRLHNDERKFVINTLEKIGKCLSVIKQQQLQIILSEFDFVFTIYSELSINNNINLFDNIDSTIEHGCPKYTTRLQYELNFLHDWLSKDDFGPCDNRILQKFYPLVSSEKRLRIIQRYFYDIQLRNTTFDIEQIKYFRDCRKNIYARCRDCLAYIDFPIDISNELLCDSIITLKESNGRFYQDINGTLDVAMQNCSVEDPRIVIFWSKILPICNGGAVYNKSFCGFIDYAISYDIDDNILFDNNIRQKLKCFFNKKFERRKYCAEESEDSTKIDYKKCRQYNCPSLKECDNQWTVPDNDLWYVNLYLTTPITGDVSAVLNLSEVSCEKIRQKISEIHAQSNFDMSVSDSCITTCLIKSKESALLDNIIKEFLKPTKIRIYPRPYILGLLREYANNQFCIEEFNNDNQYTVEQSLIDFLGADSFRGAFFEIPYNEIRLKKILKLYYYKKSNCTSRKEECFLTTIKGIEYDKYPCTPKIAGSKHQATNLHYYWCIGKECFRSNLDIHADNVASWQEYSLITISRILGYEKLRETAFHLYEPDDSVRNLAAIAIKAEKKFKQLKCRGCGHIMFPVNDGGFNRYLYFTCRNPDCMEFNVRIYLNYCFKCKRLIDSRDTKQCPNGSYVCNTCLSCCDDNLFEQVAMRYVQMRREVPFSLRMKFGQGHNNRGIFYCPECGNQLQNQKSDSPYYCNKCGITYPKLYE